jgi:sensor histidine kinase regulating citrate/malate metabolism
MLDAQKKHFEELQRRNADVRAFRHDMCTHIAVIEKYLDLNEYDKLSEYLKSIKYTTGLNETKSYTGNLAVDAVINDQIRDIAGKNIKFSFDGIFSIDEEISDFDLCSIFYNLIQNAIEGCEKVVSDSKSISIKTKNIGEKLGIVIENDTVLETIPAGCIIPTTKEDKQKHGYGMKSIKNAVEKYNGIYNNSIKDGKFIVNIVI